LEVRTTDKQLMGGFRKLNSGWDFYSKRLQITHFKYFITYYYFAIKSFHIKIHRKVNTLKFISTNILEVLFNNGILL